MLVRKRSPLLPELSREQLAQHADAQCLPVSARFRSNCHLTSSGLQVSPRSHTLPLAFADRHFYSFLWRSPQTQFAAYDRKLPSCWLRHLTRDGAKCFVHRQPGSNSTCHTAGSCQVAVEIVDWRGDVAAIQTDLAPPLWPQLQPRETRRGGKSQQAISIEDCRRCDDTGKQHIRGLPIVSYPCPVIGQAMEKQPPGLGL